MSWFRYNRAVLTCPLISAIQATRNIERHDIFEEANEDVSDQAVIDAKAARSDEVDRVTSLSNCQVLHATTRKHSRWRQCWELNTSRNLMHLFMRKLESMLGSLGHGFSRCNA